MLSTIEFILSKIYVSEQTLSKLTGKLISTKFVIVNIVQLKTRALYKVIENRGKKFNIRNYYDTVKEILYWKFNIRNLNNKVLEYTEFHLYLFTQMQVKTDWLPFVRTRVNRLFPTKILIK